MNHGRATNGESLLQAGLESLSDNWGWVLASGIALSYSALTTLASVFVLGWVLVFAGIFEMVHAFKIPRWSGFLLELLAAILYLVVGVLMIARPETGALSLTLLFAAFATSHGRADERVAEMTEQGVRDAFTAQLAAHGRGRHAGTWHDVG